MEEKVYADPVNITFAKVMEIVTYIGIGVMIVFGLLYIFGVSGFVDMKQAIANWHLSVGEFWEKVKGIEIHGYSWFLSNLSAMDCLSMIGICLLAAAPLVALVAAIFRTTQKAYIIFFLILILEFVFAVLKPIIMPGVGGH